VRPLNEQALAKEGVGRAEWKKTAISIGPGHSHAQKDRLTGASPTLAALCSAPTTPVVESFVLCLGGSPMKAHGFLTFEVSPSPGRASRQVIAVPLFETGA
jgi:hypothetical protein